MKMGVMFGGLLPGDLARQPRPEIHVVFGGRWPTRCGIKVIYIASGFAAPKRQMVTRKELEIWVKFGVAAPGPWG